MSFFPIARFRLRCLQPKTDWEKYTNVCHVSFHDIGVFRNENPKNQRNLCIFMDRCAEVWLKTKGHDLIGDKLKGTHKARSFRFFCVLMPFLWELGAWRKASLQCILYGLLQGRRIKMVRATFLLLLFPQNTNVPYLGIVYPELHQFQLHPGNNTGLITSVCSRYEIGN